MVNRQVLAIGINTAVEEKTLIQEKLKESNITLDIASIKDPVFTITNGVINAEIRNMDMSKYDCIWIQSGWNTTHMAYLLHLYLESKNIYHNKTNSHVTKLSDIFSLASKGILVPNTYFHNGLKIDEYNMSEIEEICKFPCIYKTSLGSLGSHVFLIENKCDIEQTIKDNGKFNRFLFQEYIPNDFDYRVVVANGKPTSVCIRTRVQDKYRNNVALGAREDFISIEDVSPVILDIAVQAAKTLKLNWAGVDVVTDKRDGRSYVLEVNRRPGLTENSSETIAAYKYIENLVSSL